MLGCGVIALVVIGLPLLFVLGAPYTTNVPARFNSQTWIAGRDLADNRRCAMLADLQLRTGLVDKSRDEVLALLGPPEDSDPTTGTSRWLLCPSFLDVWVLAIRWQDDRVVDAFVHDT
jgi:hypothetical protein